MFKLIELLKRKPGMSVEDFQDYWRYKHGPLVAACARIRRHVQSSALLQGYRKGELLFDGISETWFDSVQQYEVYRNAPESSVILTDQANFLDRSRTVSMPVDVHIIKDGVISKDAVKNIEFVNRRPGMALEPFRAYWRNVHGPIASRICVIQRYEQNHLMPGVYESQPAPPYDGLAITWFASTADMKKGTTTPEYAVTRADEAHFLPDGHLPIIITREHLVVG
ncbi:MAG: EthD family reductase [Burkholderiales bacterium]|nr:EthD family reductase [Burkholderiales bacterium]